MASASSNGSNGSNEENAREIIQKWQDQMMVLIDMSVRENAIKYKFNPKDIESTIQTLSEFIVEMHLSLAHCETVWEMHRILNDSFARLTRQKWELQETYDIQSSIDQVEISKTIMLIDMKLSIINPIVNALDQLLPKKAKPNLAKPPGFWARLAQSFTRPHKANEERMPVFNQITDKELGGSKRWKAIKTRNSIKLRKSKKSNKIRRTKSRKSRIIRRTRKSHF